MSEPGIAGAKQKRNARDDLWRGWSGLDRWLEQTLAFGLSLFARMKMWGQQGAQERNSSDRVYKDD